MVLPTVTEISREQALAAHREWQRAVAEAEKARQATQLKTPGR